MKTLSAVILMALAVSAQAQATQKGMEINCNASGLVDHILGVVFQETDLEGQICGHISVEVENGEIAAMYTCFNGSLLSSENEIYSVATTSGLTKVSLLKNTKGYSLGKTLNAKAVESEELHCLIQK